MHVMDMHLSESKRKAVVVAFYGRPDFQQLSFLFIQPKSFAIVCLFFGFHFLTSVPGFMESKMAWPMALEFFFWSDFIHCLDAVGIEVLQFDL